MTMAPPNMAWRPMPPVVIPPGTSPGQNLFARVLVIYGSGLTGEFIYSGVPSLGNGPVAWGTPPGVTKDPFGNTLPVSSGGFAAEQLGGGLVAQLTGGSVILTDALAVSAFTAPGRLTIVHTAASTAEPILALSSPAADTAGTVAVQWMLGGPGSGAVNPQAIFFANDNANAPSALQGFYVWGPLTFLSNINPVGAVLTNAAQLVGSAGDLTVNSLDGNAYDTEHQTQILTSVTITDVTPINQNIGNPVNIVAGRPYMFEIDLSYTEAAAGTPRFQINPISGTVLSAEVRARWQQNNASASFGGHSNGLGVVAGPVMAGNVQMLHFEVVVTMSVSGSVQLQANTSAAADTFTTGNNGSLTVYPVTV